MDKTTTAVGVINYDPPTDPDRLRDWEVVRALLKKRHRCQCFKCTWELLWKVEAKS